MPELHEVATCPECQAWILQQLGGPGSGPRKGNATQYSPTQQELITRLGTTDNPNETSFILSDGTRIKGRRGHQTHAEIAGGKYLLDKMQTDQKPLVALMKEGVIRYSGGPHGGIETIGVPTKAQAQLIADDWNHFYKSELNADQRDPGGGSTNYGEGDNSRTFANPVNAEAIRNWYKKPRNLEALSSGMKARLLILAHLRAMGGPGSGPRKGFVTTDNNKGMTVFHGTSSDALKAIKKEGLVPAGSAGGDAWRIRNQTEMILDHRQGMTKTQFKEAQAELQEMSLGDRKASVYLGVSKDTAEMYAQYAVSMRHGTPTILEIRVPAKHISRLKQDEEESAGYRIEGKIPPEWIRRVQVGDGKWRTLEDGDQIIYAVILTDEDEEPETLGGPGSGPQPGDVRKEHNSAAIESAYEDLTSQLLKRGLSIHEIAKKLGITEDHAIRLVSSAKSHPMERDLPPLLSSRMNEMRDAGGPGSGPRKGGALPPVPDGHMRLWRGIPVNPTAGEDVGPYWTLHREDAEDYAAIDLEGETSTHPTLLYVDVPAEEAIKHRVEGRLPGEYELPAHLQAKSKVLRTAGGPGSGDHGHSGRKHEVGGSGPGSRTSPKDGLRVATPKDKARMKAMGVPPGWTKVRISTDPKAALLAKGKDSKGRTQYLYSAAHAEAMAAEKFDRLKDFQKALPTIQAQIAADLKSDDPKVREAAAVLQLIDKTGFRVGGEGETGAEKQAYGASSLLAKHVDINGDRVSFAFVGKKGVDIDRVVKDAELAKSLSKRVDSGGRLFDTDANKVREYMGKIAPDYSPKDFRTSVATKEALKVVDTLVAPKNSKEFIAKQNYVGDRVSMILGNSRKESLRSYIAPSVFRKWKK